MITFKDTVRKLMHRDSALAAAACIFMFVVLRLLSSDMGGLFYAAVISFFVLVTPAVIWLDIDRAERTLQGSDPLHQNRQLSDKEIYGTAHLESPWDYRAYAQIRPLDKCVGIVLGRLTSDSSQCIDYFPDPKDPQAHPIFHMLAMGNSSSGKTFTYGKTYCFQAMKLHKSVMHTDPKGELYRDLADTYRKHGYIVRRLNFIDPEKSDGWDCLKTIKEETRLDKIEVLTQTFTDAVISNAIGGDPSSIYYSAPKLLLKALILRLVLDDTIPESDKNIKKVYEWLTNPGGLNFLDSLFDPLILTEKMRPCLSPYVLYKSSSGNLAGNIIVNLGAGMQIIGVGLISDILSRDDIDLDLPGEQPCAYFVQFPVPNDSYKFPVALFFSMIFKTLQEKAINSKGGKLKREVCFFLDEFAQCGTLPNWETYMSVIRSYGLIVFMIVQTISQFIALYKESYNTIISACAIWLLIGANDLETARYFSERCGRASFVSVSESRQGLRKLIGIKNMPTDRTTEGTGQGNLFTPDEITRIPSNQALIMLQKHNPIIAYTVPNILHPYAKGAKKTLNEDEPDFSDLSKRAEKRAKEEAFFLRYWETHKEFKVPDNIDDAPYKLAPTIWGEMKEVVIEDFLTLEKKLGISRISHQNGATSYKAEYTIQSDIDIDDEDSFCAPLYTPGKKESGNLTGQSLPEAVIYPDESETLEPLPPGIEQDSVLCSDAAVPFAAEELLPEGIPATGSGNGGTLLPPNRDTSRAGFASAAKYTELSKVSPGASSPASPVPKKRFASRGPEIEPMSTAAMKKDYAQQKTAFVQEAVGKGSVSRQYPPNSKK